MQIDPPTVVFGALKKAEGQEALIIRLAETAGRAVTADIHLDGGAAKVIAFRPYEIKTYRIARAPGEAGQQTWQTCNLLEEEQEQ